MVVSVCVSAGRQPGGSRKGIRGSSPSIVVVTVDVQDLLALDTEHTVVWRHGWLATRLIVVVVSGHVGPLMLK